jgi:hypothetical protein
MAVATPKFGTGVQVVGRVVTDALYGACGIGHIEMPAKPARI